MLLLDEGTNADYELDPDVAEVVALLDGTLTLGRAIERVVRAFDLDRRDAAELRRDTLDETHDLLAARRRRAAAAPLRSTLRDPRV